VTQVGNVYIKFRDEEAAAMALQVGDNQWKPRSVILWVAFI